MSTTTERTSQFFDQYARDFSAIYGNKNTLVNSVVNQIFRRSMRLRYEKTLAGCFPIQGKTVLDIGCGPGHYSVELARRGAALVHGVDFAEGMIDLSKRHASDAGVQGNTKFELKDFFAFPEGTKYDYTIVMGFMDYMADPKKVAEKVISLTASRAFFSFPADGGLLAWQRKLRYKTRCELFMYDEAAVRRAFHGLNYRALRVEEASRDFFVTVDV
ncbi:MAG: methyltransferase domain-containing protein [Myxococcota bacterium]